MGRFRYKERSLGLRRSLDAAVAEHEAGRFEEAEVRCRKILEVRPDYPQALHVLALSVGARGRKPEAEEALRRAVALAPSVAAFHGQLGIVLLAQDRHQEAIECFQRALAIDPKDPNSYNSLGGAFQAGGRPAEAIQQFRKGLSFSGRDTALLMNLAIVSDAQGETEEAIAAYRRLLAIQPDSTVALQNLAFILKQQGNLPEALTLYEKVVDLKPELALAHLNLGIELQNKDKLDEAAQCYLKVISMQPDLAPAHNNLGSVYRMQGRYSEAIPCLEKSIALDPHQQIAYNNLGVTLQGQKKYAQARAALDRAMELAPNDPETCNNLGNLACAQEKFDEAIEWFAKAHAFHPDCAEVHNNLANVLRDQGKLDKAEEHYRRAVELEPGFSDAWSNLGNSLREQGIFDDSLAAYSRAVELRPDNPGYRWNRSLAELTRGNLEQGWEEYEFGFGCKQRQPARPCKQPRWEGQSLTGKTILTWAEQGVGDEILFANCIPDLADAADDCIVECDYRLVSLFQRSFPECEVIPRAEPQLPRSAWPDIDLQVPFGTLPRYFRPSLGRFPREGGYLKADPARVEYWKQRLVELGPGLKVGVSWRSRIMTAGRAKHYVPLDDWSPILNIPGVCFVNLQYCDYAEDIEAVRAKFGTTIHHFEDLNLRNALDDVAALSTALDLVITISNINMNLSGATGTESWLFAVRHSQTWGTLGTNYTPWFPSVRAFHREWNETWEGVLQTMGAELRKRRAG